ncbi:GntR family transcriptional regulator [Pseudovibrio sp. Tun.PSC04-5.I4]|uniref:GntR family transcriptional regulator n=1 Tax=Pseudovibrio sp. Tun.PSC04-5.I4 TaxID=1798213 RepID=UPI00088A50A0|nr:GntR family transcriptional regulator [Pseudovibrio sp. Tun.PSC04-5.I4]SDR21957.1 DNA-binding transcriptional regulator, GntR family [Pseudovibrio sp. Tun.PSC04-5.I4]
MLEGKHLGSNSPSDMRSTNSNVAIAYRKLKQAILENQLAPGAQILEQEAATQLEMSRTPVREAMLMLQKDGLVEMRPRQGMRVLPVTVQDISEIYEILEVIESLAVRKLTEKPAKSRELQTLEDSVVLMDLSLERGDLEVWAAADKKFHENVIDFSGNGHLKKVFVQLWDRSQRARNLLLKKRGMPANSSRDHWDLLEIIRAGRVEDAVEMQRNLRITAAEELRKVILEVMSSTVLS